MAIAGGCLCGAVRYEVKAEPVFTAVCHCTHCQKQAGTAFTTVVAVPAAALSLTGALKTYHDTGDSGRAVERRFCPDCGSPIVTELAAIPNLVLIKAGTLDDASWVRPGMEVYCDRAQPWAQVAGEHPRFARMPPAA
jgi:hypothetical protein